MTVTEAMQIEDKSVLETIAVNDRLILQREDNKFDEKAILILNEKKQKLGYVPCRRACYQSGAPQDDHAGSPDCHEPV